MSIFGRHPDPLWCLAQPWLEFIPWDPANTYNPHEHVLIVPANNLDLWWRPLVDQGFKLIIENAAETPEFINLRWIPVSDPRKLAHRPIPRSALIIQSPTFFWLNTALYLKKLGRDNYIPNPTREYLALLPVAREKPHRTELLTAMADLLDRCIWSRKELGRGLPNDGAALPDIHWSARCNREWYDQTCFTLVAESMIDNAWPFLTEKTYKPLGMHHPFMIVGDRGSLHQLRALGFETWGNLWDESYDDLESPSERIRCVVENARLYDCAPLDAITVEKLQHNHAWFFNHQRHMEIFRSELLDPILEYANTSC
jgi:hypothetical protein